MNLLEETLNKIKAVGKNLEDVAFVNMNKLVFDEYDGTVDIYETVDSPLTTITFNRFTQIATEYYYNYDNGYGGAEVPETYIVFNDNTWLSRGEYDGSEWWNYNECPKPIKE